MDLTTLNARLPLEFRLGRRLVIAKKAELLDIRCLPTLCPWIKACWPEWFLPPTVILKKPKPDWEEEYAMEKQAYDILRPLQGTLYHISTAKRCTTDPRHLSFRLSLASIYSISHATSFLKARMEPYKSLEDAFRALTSYGVEYRDEKLDNFLWVDERVMVIDLEQFKFGTTDVWEENVNSATAASLMRDFMKTRNPDRMNRMSSYRRGLLSGDQLH